MRLPDDDELYEVDQTYLGPPRRYIGEMRYRTIFLFLVIAPVTLVLLRKLGMPVTLLTMGLWLIAASYLSMKASDYISSESSAGAWLMTFWHELTTPRVETDAQYAGGVAVAFRHASRPRGGWAKAQARAGRLYAPQAAATTASPRSLPAKPAAAKRPAVQTPPVRSKAAPVRPVIEAKVVEGELPSSVRGAQAVRQQPTDGVRPGKGGWSNRPAPSPREPRDVPWKGGAPWQERKQSEQPSAPPAEPAGSEQEDAPAAPAEQPPTPSRASRPAPSAPPEPPAASAAAAAGPPPPPPPAPTAPASAPAPAPAAAPAAQRPPAARQPLSSAVRPEVRIAPEPGVDEAGEFADEPSGSTRRRENQDQPVMPDDPPQRPQSVDDYRKRLDGDDAPTDGGTA